MTFDIKDGKGETVLGNVDEHNVYIKTYGKILYGKKPTELAAGEHCIMEYSLSGTKGVYYIHRTE